MYTNLYFYLVKDKDVDDFIELRHQISDIMLAYGTLEDRTYTTVSEKDSEQHRRFFQMLKVQQSENILLRQTIYRNFSHFDDIQKKIIHDADLIQLTNAVNELIHDKKVVSASFLCE